MGFFYPMVEKAKEGEFGLGPYSVAVIFAVAIVGTTLVYNMYFMNLPVKGDPVNPLHYFKGSIGSHLLGIGGGIIWMTGAITNFVAASSPEEIQVGPAISYALGQGATMISALWGLLLWKEFADANQKTMRLVYGMLALFLVGLTLISLAPVFAL
jgi:glucose uptake protein